MTVGCECPLLDWFRLSYPFFLAWWATLVMFKIHLCPLSLSYHDAAMMLRPAEHAVVTKHKLIFRRKLFRLTPRRRSPVPSRPAHAPDAG